MRNVLGFSCVMLLSLVPIWGDTIVDESGEATAESGVDTNSLNRDIKKVLARNYAGLDTTALLSRIQERMR